MKPLDFSEVTHNKQWKYIKTNMEFMYPEEIEEQKTIADLLKTYNINYEIDLTKEIG